MRVYCRESAYRRGKAVYQLMYLAILFQTIVGFVGGRFSKNQHYVIPVDDVDNITDHCKSIVKEFEKFIIDSGRRSWYIYL